MRVNNKITVVVTEDEPIILNNVVKKVEKSGDYIQVIGKAQSGREALELLEQEIPDVLITDIEMPGINGLELIKQVRSIYPSIHIIILSGYSNFEYARTAIKYGVEEYILKPIEQGDLTVLLTQLSQKIYEEKYINERNILSLTLKGTGSNTTLPYYFEEGNFILCLITLGNLPSQYVNSQHPESYLGLWDKINFPCHFKNNNNIEHYWIIDESYPLQKFVIIHSNSGDLNPNYVSISLYNYLASILDDIPFNISTSYMPVYYTEIWTTAKQIRRSVSQTVIPFSQSHKLISPKAIFPVWSLKEQKEHIELLYQLNNKNSLLSYFKNTLQRYVKKDTPLYIIDNFIYKFFGILPGIFSVQEEVCHITMYKILNLLPFYKTLDELYISISDSVTSLIQNHSSEINIGSLHKKLKQYITNNYNCKISLDDLSERYGYTASYINRIFKKAWGISPLQFMIDLRIQHAKELLKNEMEIDIKSIAATVGYDDSRYFSRVFKSETGLTPSAWAKKHGTQKCP